MGVNFDLSGKVALVTGATRGLGYQISIALARQGADIVVSSRKADACNAVAEEIRGLGRRALAYPCHAGQWTALEGLVEAAYATFGKVDILVNNAGLAAQAPDSVSVSEELFDKTIGVNLKGPFRLSALIGTRMVKAGGGSIINVGSAGAVRPSSPDVPVYVMAKAGLHALTRSHAFEFGPKVRVNSIVPGPFRTDMTKAWADEADKNATNSLKRIGGPEEIAGAAVYLASDSASYTSGAMLEVHGGFIA